MKQQTKRLASFVLSLVFLICAVFTYALFTRSAYDDVARVRGEQIGGQNFLETQKDIEAKLENLKTVSTGASGAAFREAVNRALPLSEEMPSAVAQLYGIAEENGLAVESLLATTGSSAPVRRTGKVVSVGYALQAISFDMKMTGTYAGFKRFLSGLEQNVRLFETKEIVIVPAGKPEQDLYRFAVSVTAYYQEVGSVTTNK